MISITIMVYVSCTAVNNRNRRQGSMLEQMAALKKYAGSRLRNELSEGKPERAV